MRGGKIEGALAAGATALGAVGNGVGWPAKRPESPAPMLGCCRGVGVGRGQSISGSFSSQKPTSSSSCWQFDWPLHEVTDIAAAVLARREGIARVVAKIGPHRAAG